jgi:hypothetical protein
MTDRRSALPNAVARTLGPAEIGVKSSQNTFRHRFGALARGLQQPRDPRQGVRHLASNRWAARRVIEDDVLIRS